MRRFQQGQPDNAAKKFAAATRLLPERVEGWVNLGSALLESKRYDAAAAALQKAVAINPSLMLSRLVLGDAFRMLGQWHAAMASYQDAVRLQRTPLSLNKLACALRAEGKGELAEGLYREAIAMDANFSMPRVNLATLQIELHRYDEADRQLRQLAGLSLPPIERREVELARLALSEYGRLNGAIAEMVERDELTPLETALRNLPGRIMHTDDSLLESIQRYADSAGQLAIEPVTIDGDLPGEWPLIEAMYMIPLVDSVDMYQQAKATLDAGLKPSGEMLKSVNMQAAIIAARGCRLDMHDAVKAELHLRHWHALACRGVAGFSPGHFKYTQNWVASNPTLRRVEPALASATFRHFVSDIYSKLSPGYARAAVLQMAIADLHVFADGNGRVAFTWLNRELEWAGLMPALFHKSLGLTGELKKALREVRARGGDLAPVIAVIIRAQHYAREFCAELATR